MIRIVPIADHEQYEINGKLIFKDSDGNWVCKSELTSQELNAFENYKKAQIENPNLKRHTKSTFKY